MKLFFKGADLKGYILLNLGTEYFLRVSLKYFSLHDLTLGFPIRIDNIILCLGCLYEKFMV